MAAFYTDEDASSADLIARLRAYGHTAIRAVDAQPGAADPDQVAYATRHGLILITHNWRDFCRLDAVTEHAGILVIPQPQVHLRVLYDYSYVAAAQAIDEVVASEPLANRIFLWQPIDGWGPCPPTD